MQKYYEEVIANTKFKNNELNRIWGTS